MDHLKSYVDAKNSANIKSLHTCNHLLFHESQSLIRSKKTYYQKLQRTFLLILSETNKLMNSNFIIWYRLRITFNLFDKWVATERRIAVSLVTNCWHPKGTAITTTHCSSHHTFLTPTPQNWKPFAQDTIFSHAFEKNKRTIKKKPHVVTKSHQTVCFEHLQFVWKMPKILHHLHKRTINSTSPHSPSNP